MLTCRCGGRVINDDGEEVCSRCGVVHDSVQDGPPAWSEVPPPRKKLGEKWRLFKLNRMITRPHKKTDILIESICRKCGLPDAVYKRAIALHAMVVSVNKHLGWQLEARVAAIVSLACRLERVPRTIETISKAAGVKPGQARHIYGKVVAALNISVPAPDPAAFIGSIATACDIPEVARRMAADMLQESGPKLSGKGPTTLAAAALYLACIECRCDVSQQSLADAAHVSTVSLRERRRDLVRAALGS